MENYELPPRLAELAKKLCKTEGGANLLQCVKDFDNAIRNCDLGTVRRNTLNSLPPEFERALEEMGYGILRDTTEEVCHSRWFFKAVNDFLNTGMYHGTIRPVTTELELYGPTRPIATAIMGKINRYNTIEREYLAQLRKTYTKKISQEQALRSLEPILKEALFLRGEIEELLKKALSHQQTGFHDLRELAMHMHEQGMCSRPDEKKWELRTSTNFRSPRKIKQ